MKKPRHVYRTVIYECFFSFRADANKHDRVKSCEISKMCVCALSTTLVKGCGACPDGFRPSRFRSGTSCRKAFSSGSCYVPKSDRLPLLCLEAELD